MALRKISRVFENIPIAESKDYTARRIIGSKELGELDPFVLLEWAEVVLPKGALDHPHRGMQAVDYILDGADRYEDFFGHRGDLKAGDLQWLTAGRGIVHCEFPDPNMTGLQLWVSLSKANKMVQPECQTMTKAKILIASRDGVTVSVMAGESMGVKSPIKTITPVHYMDFRVKGGSKFSQPIHEGWNCIAYVLTGTVLFGPPGAQSTVKPHHTVLFEKNGGSVHFENPSTNPADESRFILLSGQPLNEPIFRHDGNSGIIMNSPEEVQQGVQDYLEGKNGFENVKTWKSFYKKQQEALAAQAK